VAAAPSPTADAGIDWFKGDVDAAFAEAQRSNRPVFLYWGASWCPPCHELKATVFSRPDFIQKSRLFVTVYLDGDNPGAQKWGELFRVRGYPTVLILRSDRTELERISGGMDLSLYGEALDLALGDVRPAEALLVELATSNAALSRDDCRRLAYNAWFDVDRDASDAVRLAEHLAHAAELCPADAKVERARLYVAAAAAQSIAEKPAIDAHRKPSPRLSGLLAQVQRVLEDRELAGAAADSLESLDAAYFAAAKEAATDTQALKRAWIAAMDGAAADPRYSEADHLDALESKLTAVKTFAPGNVIPGALVAEAHARIDTALQRTTEEHARASVVNSALNVLEVLGDDERAYALLKQQMASSRSPYYYMDDIADLDEKYGRTDSAIGWLMRGYEESQGAATRFQWGTNYVNGLIRMRPADEARIRSATLQVLGELDGPDRIYQRTRSRLVHLDTNLRKWNQHGEHAATIALLRKRMDDICARIPANEPARPVCAGFLSST
jgi:thiol-disulfide isomerase/thioredoxin